MLKTTLTRCLVLTTLVSMPAAASAAVSLADLIADQSMVVAGDNLFDQFGYSRTAGMPSADSILVAEFVDLNSNRGLRFSGPFLVDPSEGLSNATISYRVSAIDSMMALSGAFMQGNPAVVNPGYFRITETLAAVPATLQIRDEVPGQTKLVDSTDFDSLFSELNVELVFEAEPLSDTSFAMASFVDQTFSQSVVPEPASVVIWLGMALLIGGVPYVYRRYAPAAEESRL